MLEYFSNVLAAVRFGLTLDTTRLSGAAVHPNAFWIAVGMIVLVGASVLLGQSVGLFLSRVPPRRFLLSLLLNGVLFVFGVLFWSLLVWWLGWLFLPTVDASYRRVALVIALSYAPFVFGFLILLPYAGIPIDVLLYVWSALLAVRGVEYVFQTGFWPALWVVFGSFLVMFLVQSTIGKPIQAISNRLLGISGKSVRQQLGVD